MDTFQISYPDSGSDAIAWVSLVVATIALAWTVYWNRRAEKRAYLDEFWFREVVAPRFVNPILELQEAWFSRIDGLAGKSIDAAAATGLISEFQKDKSRVTNSAWIVQIYSLDIYNTCCEEMDRVEDVFAEKLGDVIIRPEVLPTAITDMRANLGDATVALLSAAARVHGGKLAVTSKIEDRK